jgi:hypothetical protein
VHASTRVVEVGVTMAAKHLLDGSLHYCSHKFHKLYIHNLINYLDAKHYTVGMSLDETRAAYTSSTPPFFDYAFRGDGVLDDIDYHDYCSQHDRKKKPCDPDDPGDDHPFHPSHPLALTHCISKRRHIAVPQIVGARMPDLNKVGDDDDARSTLYFKMALALHSPWRNTAPPWSDSNPPRAAHAACDFSATATRRLANHQDYYDQQRLAHASAKARRAAAVLDGDANPANGLNLDDYLDGGAALLDAIAMAEIGGKPATRAVPKSVVAHFDLVEAAIDSGSCTVAATAVDAALLASVAAAEPPTEDAWKPTLASVQPQPEPAAEAAAADQQRDTPRALLVSRALTSAAEASAANTRAANAAVVPITFPSLATVSASFQLNREQDAAFRVTCLPLLRHYLDLAVGEDDDATAAARTHLATASLTEAPPLVCMVGEGGTGKSEVIKAVTHFASAWGLRAHLAITAPTGAAAVLIGGSTVHSFAGINVYAKTTKENVTSAQQADDPTASIVLLIIDEVSLVSAEFLGKLSSTLQRKRNNTSPFGGLAVLFCGDFYQLPPVSGLPLYDTSDAAVAAGVDAQTGFDAWARLSHVVMLKTNYRAAGDPDWMALLQRVRSHTVEPRDLATLGRMRVSPSHMPPLDAAAAWYANADVNATNCNAVHYAAAAAKSTVHRFPAAVRPSKAEPPVTPDGPAHAGYVVGSRNANRADLLYSFLDVYIGCPVTVNMSNALTKHGIANGSRGVIIGTYPPLADIDADDVYVTLPTGNKRPVRQLRHLPSHLLVHVPGSTIKFAGLPASVLPVALKQQSLHVHGHKDKMHVSQFPVKLNFAWTCHKLQGKTEDRVTLGCTNKNLNWNYTALSRIRALAALYVLKGVKLTTATFNCPSAKYDMLVAEMARLESISVQTLARVAAAGPSPVQQAPPPGRRPSPANEPTQQLEPQPTVANDEPPQQLQPQSTEAEREFVVRNLEIMFDVVVPDGDDNVAISDFAEFLRQSPFGVANFSTDQHLAAVLADVSREHITWMVTATEITKI